jgi:putative restriction endonuclease
MTRGVFLHRADSIYQDEPASQYQFPPQYLSRASQFVGDWIIYYEPRRGPTGRGYFAIARVEKIVPDPSTAGMYLALIEPGSYLEFEQAVPFSDSGGPVERGVLNEVGRISGRAQSAVRPISIEDFNRILDRGMPDEDPLYPREGPVFDRATAPVFEEEHAPFILDAERDRVEYYVSRPVRDRVFRKRVLAAYDCRCAITGLRFINGGGRAEVEAAHIKPVERQGPDSVRNGIALSGTVHWMFDRGLISLSDDYDVLVSRQVNDVERVWALVHASRKAAVPTQSWLKPHPRFLDWHRRNCFKQ